MNTNDGYDLKYFLRPIRDNKVFFVSIFSIVMIFSIYFSLTLKKYWISEVIIRPINPSITNKMNMALPNYSYINNQWEYENTFKPQVFVDEYIKLFLSQKEKKEFYLESSLFKKNKNNKDFFEKLNKELFYRYDKENQEYIFYAKTNNAEYGYHLIKKYTKYIYNKMSEAIESSEKKNNQEKIMILRKKILIQYMVEDYKNKQFFFLKKDLLGNRDFHFEKNNFNLLTNKLSRHDSFEKLNDSVNVDGQYSFKFYNRKILPLEINIKLIKTYLSNLDMSKLQLLKIDKRKIIQFEMSDFNNIFILLAGTFLATIIAIISSIIKFSFRRDE